MHTLVFRSIKRTHDMFLADHTLPLAEDEKRSETFVSSHTNNLLLCCYIDVLREVFAKEYMQ